jgi:hypothetical protein
MIVRPSEMFLLGNKISEIYGFLKYMITLCVWYEEIPLSRDRKDESLLLKITSSWAAYIVDFSKAKALFNLITRSLFIRRLSEVMCTFFFET